MLNRDHSTDEVMVEDVVVAEPKKTLFPADDIRKIDLAEYYDAVSRLMLPHLKDRPLLLEHYPEGIGRKGAYQRAVPHLIPAFASNVVVENKEKGEKKEVLLCQNTKTLISLISLDHVTYHGGLSRFDKPMLPDKMVIDLDPPDVTYFEETVEAAFLLKGFLEEDNMLPYVMSTGSAGLHVVCPLRRNRQFEQVQVFLQDIVQRAVARRPQLVTSEPSRERRGEKIHLGLAKNSYGASSIIPYSVRAMEHAPVATPLQWEELESSDMHPQRYNVANMAKRIAQKGDVWENFFRHKRKLMK